MMASCTSTKIGLVNTAPANQTFASAAPAAGQADWTPAAAQGAPAGEVYASASEETPAAVTVSTLEKASRENLKKYQAPQAEKQSLASRMVTKALVKKMEKASSKFDGKNEKAKKAGKVSDPQIRTGIIIALVGLGLLLVGALTALWFLYTLGGIGITVGLVIILLAALDVI